MKETEENYIRRKCLERLKDNPEAGVMDFQEGIYAGIQYYKNKYSEEDMLLSFETGRNFQLTGENNFNELIEQFKNK